LREEFKQLGKERIGIEKEVASWKEKVEKASDGVTKGTKEAIEFDNLRIEGIKIIRNEYNKTLEERLKGLNSEIESLKQIDEFSEKRIKLAETYREKELEIQKAIDVLPKSGEGTQEQERTLKILQEMLETYKIIFSLKDEDIKKEREINDIRDKAASDILELTKKKTLLEIDEPNNKKDILALELQISQRKIDQYRAVREITEGARDQLKLTQSINDEEIRKLGILEAQKREESIIYDWTQRLKETSQTWHDVVVGALTEFTTGFSQGLGSLFYDFASGFQEQQQEVADLKGELAELGQEYSEAVSEGDIDRTKEINTQMAELKNRISELEDPLENLKQGFKDFFKSLIDNIGEAISQWIAMQIVMGAVTSFASSTNVSTIRGGAGGGYGFATGGVLPNIKSFRSFSSGGMTNSKTLALLGDNSSKREIVIPTENISQNHVSGYMRDRSSEQPIYIINAIGDDDIAQQMGKQTGERVILNAVFKNKETVIRALNS